VSRWPNKHVVGLTGNIAVGKSVVRQMLQHLGAHTIDADGLAHQAMSPGAPAYQPIVDTFGTVILNEDKTINRALLGSMVFSNPALLQKLEAITHPVIGAAIDTLINHSKKRVIIIEAIKLLEGDLAKSVNEVWVVNASPKTQYSRLITKRKLSEDDAKQRILSQNAQSEKLKKADVVITNDGDIEATWKQVQTAWNIIKGKLSVASAPVSPTSQPTAQPTTQTPIQTPSTTAVTTMLTRQELHSSLDTSEAPVVDTIGISVRRGMPTHAETIAGFINKETGKNIQRLDVIMSFGQKSYLIAEFEEKVVGVIGWQVENLITRIDELYVEDIHVKQQVIYAMLKAAEKASFELQSEVSFIFLPPNTSHERIAVFTKAGYDVMQLEQIKVPAWRESVQELHVEGGVVLGKPLRTERVLKPI
jgi:dephospho-CoA kinase